jgi:Uma2 family endonuclease
MTAQTIKMYSEKEYLELERDAEYKSEYYRGEIFAMAGAGHNHNRIKENLSIEIRWVFERQILPKLFQATCACTFPKMDCILILTYLLSVVNWNFQRVMKIQLVNPSAIIEVLSKNNQYL